MNPTHPARLAAVLLLALLPAAAGAARWSEPEVAGLVTQRAIGEISGLAASRTFPGHWWAINDSGNGRQLHLVDARGRWRGEVELPVGNIDWEDLSGFELEGRRYLLVADTGDNGGIRGELALHVIEEPASLDAPARLAWTVRFRWPDGPRDCEAATVDPARGEVLLVSKKRVPPELFRVPLRPAGDDLVVAEKLGTVAGIAQPTEDDLARNPVYGRYRAQVTAADLSANGRVLAVLSYRAVHFIVRGRGEDWPSALARPASELPLPWMPQAEAAAFSPDGRELVVGSEQLPSPLVRFRVEE